MAKPIDYALQQAQKHLISPSVRTRGRKYVIYEEAGTLVQHKSLGPIHKRDGVTPIDSDWQTSPEANWLWEVTDADYEAFAMPNNTAFDSGEIYLYRHESTGEDISFQPRELKWTNDLDAQDIISQPSGTSLGTASGDVIAYVGAYGAGTSFELRSGPSSFVKRLTIDSLSALGTPSASTIAGGNPKLSLTLRFGKSNAVDIRIGGTIWDEKNNNPQIIAGAVQFEVAGQVVWEFNPAWALGSGKSELIVPDYRFRKSGNSLFIDILIDYAWVQNVTFPLIIDPTIDDDVAAGVDDAWEDDDGSMDRTATSVDSWYTGILIGHRFSLDIASGSIITSCTSSIRLIRGYVDIDCDIALEDVANAGAIGTSSNDFSNRTLTSSTVNWSTSGTNNAYNESPSYGSILQGIIDKGSWAANNNVLVILTTSGAPDFDNQQYESGNPPQITVVYTEPAAGGDSNAALISKKAHRRQAMLAR